MKNTIENSKVDSLLVFGAKDHIGNHVVHYCHQHAPHVKLRVATHLPKNRERLQQLFPYAEVVVADYFDLDSLSSAVDGMQGIFQISPDVFNEDLLVENMARACDRAGTVRHIVRILGTPPGATISLVPERLQVFRHYPAMQHLVATDLYRESGLPVTFVNVAGYYMDDFTRMFAQSIIEDRTIRIAFDKWLAWIDPQDVAEVSAELLLNTSAGNERKVIDVTGQDLCKISTVARMLGEELGTEIAYDGDERRFLDAIRPVFTQMWGEDAPEYFVDYFRWETQHDHLFKLTPCVQDILGRQPKPFRQWMRENRSFFLDAWSHAEIARTA